MATVPTIVQQPDSVSPAPQYESASAPSAILAEQQGKSLQAAGSQIASASDQLFNAAAQEQAKRDAVQRARDLGNFQTQAQQMLQAASTAGDITDPNTVASYSKQLSDLLDQTVKAHPGSPDSAAALSARLNEARTGFVSRANEIQSDAQDKLIKQTVGSQLSPVVNQAYQDPSKLLQYFSMSDGVIHDMSPALGTVQSQALTNQGRQDILRSAVQGLIDRGQIDQAQKVMAENAQLLTPDTQQFLNTHITVAQSALTRDQNEVNAKISAFKQVTGRSPSQIETLAMMGVRPDTASENSAAVANAEKYLGRKLTTPEYFQVTHAAGVGQMLTGSFGNSLQGREQAIVTNNAPAYAAGLLGPEQEREFETAMAGLSGKSKIVLDPTTNTQYDANNIIPQFAIEAIMQRGRQSVLQQGQVVTPNASIAPAGSAAGGGSGNGAPPAAAASAQPPQGPANGGNSTIWQLNSGGKVTGVAPTLAEGAHRLPGVGGLIPDGGATQARQYVEDMRNNLLSAFQKNPKFSPTELKGLAGAFDITPSLHDNSTSYADRLIGADNAAAQQEAEFVKRGSDYTLSAEDRRQARDLANRLQNFRDVLGVPPKVTPQQAAKLPKGTMFRTDDGRLMVARGPQE